MCSSDLASPRVSAGTARSAAARTAPGRVIATAFTATAAVLNAFRVRQFVPEAAFQTTAEARQLRRVETQTLLLGHLDRDRIERREKRRAAERPPARAVAAEHLGLVTDAYLPHLDTDVQFTGELSYEFPERSEEPHV